MRFLVLSLLGITVLGPSHRAAERSVPLCRVVEKSDGQHLSGVVYAQKLVRDAQLIVRARALREGSSC